MNTILEIIIKIKIKIIIIIIYIIYYLYIMEKLDILELVNNHTLGELSKLLDNILKPGVKEKQTLGEVSTPYNLRQEMLDKMPSEFWGVLDNKIFEPCSGKSGFLVDIVDRFMEGLNDKIENREDRYKKISIKPRI